mmetsp:Transcript_65831/g.157212  ORF Transcript_65831/g.157212 Transcript_65831/m.157212 type:complete len:642 (-) Transcript_65831:48-1973(-)
METEGFVAGEDKAARAAEEEEVDDDEWSDLERFDNFSRSQHPLRRLVCVRGLPDLVASLTVQEALRGVLPALEEAVQDEESSVRDALASNLAATAKSLLERATPDEQRQVVEQLWIVSEALLKDKDQQVKNVAEDGVVEYVPLCSKELIMSPIMASVLELANGDVEEHRMTAMKLLGEFSFALGQQTVKETVSGVLVNLASDAMFRVRKTAALYIGKVCRWVPKEHAVSTLLPIYLALADDEIWGVRKACAESMADVAAALPADIRGTTILPLFDKLATDVSRWVRNSAFQHLGPLIATLSCEEVTPKLLQYYASMATGKGNSGGAGDSEMPTFCAYNFPAVVLTVGRDNWKHLEEAYKELVKDIQWKVRRTLSFSVHEIALILGPELTQSSLLPALDTFLRDLDEVKVGVLQNLAKLLGVLTPAARQQYVPLLCNLEMESDNWRFRQLLAQQLGELFFLFEEEVIQTELYPIFMKLCRDPVAEVRNMAGQQLIPILARLKDLKVNWMDEFIEELQDLATDRLFQHRLMFAHMCHAMAKQGDDMDREVFNKDFLPQLLDLSEDQVGNIRQRAGLALQLLVGMSGIDDSKVKARIAKLVSDKDIEVLRSMGCAMNLGTTSCRHYNLANGAAKDAELRAAMTS